MARHSLAERYALELQALDEIDRQCLSENSYVSVADWESKYAAYLGPFYNFLKSHPKRYVVKGTIDKFRVSPTTHRSEEQEAPAAAAAGKFSRAPPPAFYEHGRGKKECKFWLQGKCIYGDRCKFGHGQPLQSSAALYEPRGGVRTGPYGTGDVIGQKPKPREAHESEIGVTEPTSTLTERRPPPTQRLH